mgnify:CR=1 FL=1
MHSIYVYYRVQPELAGEARHAIENMLAAVRAETGVVGRLLCKRDQPTLWMEVYDPVPDTATFERALAQAVSRAGATRFLVPGQMRTLECFLG